MALTKAVMSHRPRSLLDKPRNGYNKNNGMAITYTLSPNGAYPNGNTLVALLDAAGRPLIRKGRPPLPENLLNGDVDPKQEYTQRGGVPSASVYGSPFAANLFGGLSLNNYGNQLEKLTGNVDDVDLTLGWHQKEQMDRDGHCAAALDVLALGATARPYEVVPTSEREFSSDQDKKWADENAAFVARACRYLAQTHRDLNLTGFQLLRLAFKIGHSKAEITDTIHRGGPDDRKLVPMTVRAKSRRNSAFVVDRTGSLVGIAGYTGDYQDGYVDPTTQMTPNGYVLASQLGSGWKLLDRDKFVVVTNRPPEDDSPLGTSLYRRAYFPYRNKRDAWAWYCTWLDKLSLPEQVIELPPIMEMGAGPFYGPDANGLPDTDRGQISATQSFMEWALYARQAGALAIPNGGKAYYLNANSSGDPFSAFMSTVNNEITLGILLQTLATQDSRNGTRAQAVVHQDSLQSHIHFGQWTLEDALTRDLFGPLIRNNMPPRQHHLIPRISFGDVDLNDFAAWATAIARLRETGVVISSQLPYVWKMLGLPQGDPGELEALIASSKQLLAEASQPQTDSSGTSKPSVAAKAQQSQLSEKIARKNAVAAAPAVATGGG